MHTSTTADARPSAFTSVDPAPPTSSSLLRAPAAHTPVPPAADADAPVPALRAQLLDPARPLFERYRAMFALRNLGTRAAVDALAAGLADDSALFQCAPSPRPFRGNAR